jgi:hypothetical protein
MRTASIASLPRRLAALVGVALAVLVLTATPAAAHPGHGAEAGHEHTLPLAGWALVVLGVLVVVAAGVLLTARSRARRVEPVRP